MVFAKLLFILACPVSPISLSLNPKATKVGVCLRLASLVMTSTVPFWTAAILVLIEPRSIPMTEFVNVALFVLFRFIVNNYG